MIFQKRTQKEEGFTLVETLVAITILLIVIVGPMSISTSSSKSTSFASEQVIAFFLAQEGVEIVHKIRDDELLDQNLDPGAWDDIMDDSNGALLDYCYTDDGDSGCGLELNTDNDATLNTVIRCDNTDCLLNYSETGGRAKYTYSTAAATPTIFSRVITMKNTTNDEVHVESTVYWRTGSQRSVQKVVVDTYLYDFYGN